MKWWPGTTYAKQSRDTGYTDRKVESMFIACLSHHLRLASCRVYEYVLHSKKLGVLIVYLKSHGMLLIVPLDSLSQRHTLQSCGFSDKQISWRRVVFVIEHLYCRALPLRVPNISWIQLNSLYLHSWLVCEFFVLAPQRHSAYSK